MTADMTNESMMPPPDRGFFIPIAGDEIAPDADAVVLIAEEVESPEMAELLLPPGSSKSGSRESGSRESGSRESGSSDPGLWLYRDRTMALLRRYGRLSVEVGRVPSLLGREFFRTRVTSYRVATFEDAVIFVHDVEQAQASLDWFDKRVIARVVFQDFTQYEAARLMGCGRRTVVRRFPEALDLLSELFLAGGLLTRLPERNPRQEPGPPESCQEGESGQNCLSDCKQAE
jgi:hypothetical protein